MVKKRNRKPNPSTAVGYVRVSKGEQTLSPEAQETAIRAFCTREGLDLVAVHVEAVSSGEDWCDRDGLQTAIADVETRGAGALVCAVRDRVGRNAIELALVERALAPARLLQASGVANGSAPEDVLLRTVLDAIAQYERASIRRRTKAALAVKKARNERTGTIPWGKALGPDGRTLVPCDRELAALASAKSWQAKGRSLAWIASQLATEGHLGRTGKPLSAPAVWAMLRA